MDSIHAFAQSRRSTSRIVPVCIGRPLRDTPLHPASNPSAYIRDVERITCGIVNRLAFKAQKKSHLDHPSVATDAIYARRQDRRAVTIRHIVSYYIRVGLSFSFPQIGRHMSRDHTSIMSGYRNVCDALERWPNGRLGTLARCVDQELCKAGWASVLEGAK